MTALEERAEQLADAEFECRVMVQKYGDLTPEQRVGAKFSASTLKVLKSMYDDMQQADDLFDTWIPKMADLLGVPNTNTEDQHNADGSPKGSGASSSNQDAPASSTATDGRSVVESIERRRRMERASLRKLGL